MRTQSEIHNPKSKMEPRPHAEQAKRLTSLSISHRAAARDLGVPASTFSTYLLTGKMPARLVTTDLPDRLDRYLKIKLVAAGHAAPAFRSAPMSGKFSQVHMPLVQMAEATAVEFRILKRGIYWGLWPDEMTYSHILKWIEQQITAKGESLMLTKITLPEEVLKHFSLKRDPFTNEMEDGDDIMDTRELKAAERKIMTAVEKAGWVAITGEVGSGKSTLVKKCKMRLATKKEVAIVEPRTIEKQYLGASHVCDSILQDLGTHVVLSQRTLEHKARLVGRTLEEAYKDGTKVVVLIDEAHLLRDDALLALKRIYEFEIGFKKLISIVLVGQQSLARRLKTNFNLTEVSQRVDLYELGALNGALGGYVAHKLARAGCNKEIFEPSAIRAIAKKRIDTPLLVNNIAAAALIGAYDVSQDKVTADIIDGI